MAIETQEKGQENPEKKSDNLLQSGYLIMKIDGSEIFEDYPSYLEIMNNNVRPRSNRKPFTFSLPHLTPYAYPFAPQKKIINLISSISSINSIPEIYPEMEVLKETEVGVADLFVKDFIKQSNLVEAAFKTYKDALEYSVVLKNDDVESKVAFRSFLKSTSKKLAVMNNVIIHYISSEFKKSIIYAEKIT